MVVQNHAIFTICSNNYVPMAAVLLQSAGEHHPNATLYLCLADKLLPEPGFYPPGCQIITAEDLDIPEFRQFAFRYDIMEFNTAVKPFMFLYLLKHKHDAILYFDPDIEIFSPLDDIVCRLYNGASFVVTPHLLYPSEGDSYPNDVDIMRAGTYNLGFLGVGATAEAPAILDWWARRLRYQCISDQRHGLFVDQKFFDLVPGFADEVHIVRHSRHNVAYWNLAQRRLEADGSAWRVDENPLGFFHFSGFDCFNLNCLSKYTDAFRDGAIFPSLRLLMQHYAERVISKGYEKALGIPYGYGYFGSGAQISDHARRLFRSLAQPWSGDPFTLFEAHVPPLNSTSRLSADAEELALQVQAIYASTSWRLTRPLRMLKELLMG